MNPPSPEKNCAPAYNGHLVPPQSPPWAPDKSVHLLDQLQSLALVRQNSALTKKCFKNDHLNTFWIFSPKNGKKCK